MAKYENLKEKLYRSTSDPDIMSIVIGDAKGFSETMEEFWQKYNSHLAEKYIRTAIREGRHDFLTSIADRIVQEDAIPKETILFILKNGIEYAVDKQDRESIDILLDKFKKYTDDTDIKKIMQAALMCCCPRYINEVPHISFIDFLISRGGDINHTTAEGPPYSFVEHVILSNKLVLAEMIISRDDFDISCHQPPKAKYSLLNSAISVLPQYDSKKLVRLIIEKGASVNYPGGGRVHQMPSPAGLAAAKGDIAILHILAENGADLSEKDMSGNSPIDYVRRVTLEKGQENSVLSYLNIVTDGAVTINISNEDKKLIAAIKKNSLALVRKALKNGADPNTYFKPKKYLIPALNYAILLGCDADITKELIGAGADPNSTDLLGIPPLNMLAMELEVMAESNNNSEILYNGVKLQPLNADKGFLRYKQVENYRMFSEKLLKIQEVLISLLDAGANPGIFVNELNYGGILPSRKEDEVQQNLSFGLLSNVLKHFRNIYWKNIYWEDVADDERIFNYPEVDAECRRCRKIIVDMCRTMLDHGLDPNRLDREDVSVVEMAAQCNLNEVLKMFFEAGATGNNMSSRTACHPFFSAVPYQHGNYWGCSLRDNLRKLYNVDPTEPPGTGIGYRRMSDMEMEEKINAIKESADIFADYGYAPEKDEIEEQIKGNRVYDKFPDLREYIVSSAERGRKRKTLLIEDSENYERCTPDFAI